jgi:hypothetical protein
MADNDSELRGQSRFNLIVATPRSRAAAGRVVAGGILLLALLGIGAVFGDSLFGGADPSEPTAPSSGAGETAGPHPP